MLFHHTLNLRFELRGDVGDVGCVWLEWFPLWVPGLLLGGPLWLHLRNHRLVALYCLSHLLFMSLVDFQGRVMNFSLWAIVDFNLLRSELLILNVNSLLVLSDLHLQAWDLALKMGSVLYLRSVRLNLSWMGSFHVLHRLLESLNLILITFVARTLRLSHFWLELQFHGLAQLTVSSVGDHQFLFQLGVFELELRNLLRVLGFLRGHLWVESFNLSCMSLLNLMIVVGLSTSLVRGHGLCHWDFLDECCTDVLVHILVLSIELIHLEVWLIHYNTWRLVLVSEIEFEVFFIIDVEILFNLELIRARLSWLIILVDRWIANIDGWSHIAGLVEIFIEISFELIDSRHSDVLLSARN